MSLPPYDQSIRDLERQYQVVLPDSVGQAALGFRDGVWFRVNSGAPRPVPIRSAIILCPHAAGSIVQIACWWMRENARTSRALDLATELALAVGELARKAIEDDPLGMSIDHLTPPSTGSGAGSLLGLPQGGGYPAGGGFGGSANGYSSGSFATSGSFGADAGAGASPGYGSGSYDTAPAYQGSNEPYGSYPGTPPGPGAPVSAAATTLLPPVPSDGYGAPPAPRGPALPPRGGMNGGGPGQPSLGSSGGYPQRPAPLSGQPLRPQQGGRYPQQQQGGRPAPGQGRPMPRSDRYEDEPYRGGDLPGRPPSRPSARPEPGSAW